MYYALFTNKPNENNELKPITTVSIDHVLPKIDLEIEHILIGVKNRCRCSESKIGTDFWNTCRAKTTSKIGAGFRPRVSSA